MIASKLPVAFYEAQEVGRQAEKVDAVCHAERSRTLAGARVTGLARRCRLPRIAPGAADVQMRSPDSLSQSRRRRTAAIRAGQSRPGTL